MNDEVKKISYKILKLTKTGLFKDELKEHTERVNKLNEEIDKVSRRNQEFMEYIRGKIAQIQARAKRKRVLIEE